MDMQDIKQANRDAGFHFFDRDTMRFFDSRILSQVYSGPGGVFFVTSERGPAGPRGYTVRQRLENGDVTTAQGCPINKWDKIRAQRVAHKLAQGVQGAPQGTNKVKGR